MLHVKAEGNTRRASTSNGDNVVIEAVYSQTHAYVYAIYCPSEESDFYTVAEGAADGHDDMRANVREATKRAMASVVDHTELDEWDLKAILDVFAEFVADING